MAFVYDMARCGQVNTETGEFMSDLMALNQQKAQMASYSNIGHGLGGALAGLTGGITSAVTIGTGTTSANYTIGVYGDAYQPYEGQTYIPPAAAAPVKDDEFSWLRKRVEDVCWKQAA